MNRRLLTAAWAAWAFVSSSASAQETPSEMVSRLPSLPQRVCQASETTILQWNDNLLALKNKLAVLQADEKRRKEHVLARAEARTELFEPAQAERIQLLGEEIQTVEAEINSIHTAIISSFVEKQGSIELKYAGVFDKPEQRLSKCQELSAARAEFLTRYRYQLDRLIALGIKGNRLADEMMSRSYIGYTFRTQYGIWLDEVAGFVSELSHLYDDVPGITQK